MPLTDKELRDATARLERAKRRVEEARGARDELVVRALAEDWTHARIAAATGLSRGRISQFVVEPGLRRPGRRKA